MDENAIGSVACLEYIKITRFPGGSCYYGKKNTPRNVGGV